MSDTLMDCETLHARLQQPGTVVIDCRHDLMDADRGRRDYLAAHIPGAVYADLHGDLSGPPRTDCGRHPMPAPPALVETLRCLGINNASTVIAYDDMSGAFAARLWWLLRYMGHAAVRVLDGGWQHWQAAGMPTSGGDEQPAAGDFTGQPRDEWLVTVGQVPSILALIDSRDPARYRGETEPLDRVAGHIPGARNYFWKNNLQADGRFKSPGELRYAFETLLAGVPPEQATFYCGSGVTACHNLLAAAHAGLPSPRLYAGSWSEWCADPDRPVATGDEPS